MSGLSDSALLISLVVLVLFSGLFSAIETAYSSASRIKLKALAPHMPKAAGVLTVLEDYDRFISTVLIANNIVNILAATIGTLYFTRLFQEHGPAISTVVITVAVLLFGEIAPKTIAKRMPESFAVHTLGFVQFFEFLLTPLTWLFSGWQWLVNKMVKIEEDDSDISDELITMVDEAQKEGDLEEHQSDLISAAIEFNDLDVKDVLTPRVKIVAVPITGSIEEVEKIFRANSYSRLPVYETNIDNIVGVIHEKDLYSMLVSDQKQYLRRIIKPVIYTSENVKLFTLLKQLQYAKLHLAVVLDEYGGTAGIITMEDIIEELVGEIYDEHDTVQEYYERVGENSWLVKCTADIDDMMEKFDVDYDEDEYDFITVSGWVIHELDRIPQAGDEFDYKNLHVTVTRADQRKVNEIRVDILTEKE
ncbi:MAG: HlyC/CorC family transporter [Solobacterium sp.]|nr:HlyC/CorC family transporter [Solobacterium sp.]